MLASYDLIFIRWISIKGNVNINIICHLMETLSRLINVFMTSYYENIIGLINLFM